MPPRLSSKWDECHLILAATAGLGQFPRMGGRAMMSIGLVNEKPFPLSPMGCYLPPVPRRLLSLSLVFMFASVGPNSQTLKLSNSQTLKLSNSQTLAAWRPTQINHIHLHFRLLPSPSVLPSSLHVPPRIRSFSSCLLSHHLVSTFFPFFH